MGKLAWLRRLGARLAMPGLSIRSKILIPYALLSLALAFGGTYVITGMVAGSYQERFHNQLREASTVASDSVVRREREHLATLRAVAFTEGVAEAASSRDRARLEELVLPIAVNANVESVMVLDASGTQTVAVTRSGRDDATYTLSPGGIDRSTWRPVAQVLEAGAAGRENFAGLVRREDGALLVTAGPIFNGPRLVGVAIVSTSLESVLAGVKSEALGDLVAFDSHGGVLASTIAGLDAATLPTHLQAGGLVEVDVTGREYAILAADFRVRGDVWGTLGVALPTSFVTTANHLTRNQLALLSTIGTLAILGTGWWLARLLTTPLLRLVEVARAVGTGDLTARARLSGGGEVGLLGQTFDAMTERVQRQHLGTIGALVSAIDARDPYTRGHSVRVGRLSVELGTALGLSESQLQHLQIGGLLHDVGKIGVRDSVLLKPGALTPEERALIEEHPRIGLDILATVDLPPEVLAIVGNHHERLDGGGYPLSLSAVELSMFPRIASVADVYDALVTDRPYRAGMTPDEALRILNREALKGALDRAVVATMQQLAPLWEERRHDDPALQGFTPTDHHPLVLPSERHHHAGHAHGTHHADARDAS